MWKRWSKSAASGKKPVVLKRRRSSSLCSKSPSTSHDINYRLGLSPEGNNEERIKHIEETPCVMLGITHPAALAVGAEKGIRDEITQEV
jgi:hypothetical protein